jgi:hypothetical protein
MFVSVAPEGTDGNDKCVYWATPFSWAASAQPRRRRRGRAAGRAAVRADGALYRRAGIARVAYGHSISINRVDRLDEQRYDESPVARRARLAARRAPCSHGGRGRRLRLDLLVRCRRWPRRRSRKNYARLPWPGAFTALLGCQMIPGSRGAVFGECWFDGDRRHRASTSTSSPFASAPRRLRVRCCDGLTLVNDLTVGEASILRRTARTADKIQARVGDGVSLELLRYRAMSLDGSASSTTRSPRASRCGGRPVAGRCSDAGQFAIAVRWRGVALVWRLLMAQTRRACVQRFVLRDQNCDRR